MNKPIQQSIANIALVIADYDDAIAFYTHKLQFKLVEDTDLGAGKRWVQLSPPNSTGANLLLAKASNEQQLQSVGNQAGGRVFLFLHTNDFWRDYEFMSNLVRNSMALLRYLKTYTVLNGICYNPLPTKIRFCYDR